LSNIQYRPDIDGLRAIAILTVVLFHAHLGLTGGFVGVDVFFVISGFLISSIIVKETAERRFSYWNFYKRRALRILPALFAMIIGCFLAGWFILPPFDYHRFASSAIAAIAFYPNFYFLNNSGYFAAEAITQPLLHTWSLGVEEQFYFVAPILLILGVRFPRFRTPAFVAIFLASLGWSAWQLGSDASAAFYMLPSRAFELMVGMALALKLVPTAKNQLIAEIEAISGLAMIFAAAIFYTEATKFPGIAALLPCIGTALLIHANAERATAIAKGLSVSPMVFIGKISYSFYLWHWPVLVFATYKYGPTLDMPVRVGLMVLAALLATLSYYLVEQPVRIRGSRLPARAVVAVSVIAILLWWPATAYVKSNDGLPWRLPAAAADFASRNPVKVSYTGLCHDPAAQGKEGVNCDIGAKDGKPTFLLFGDSHASAIASTVNEIALDKGLTGHALFRGGCAPVIGLRTITTGVFAKCTDLFDNLQPTLENNPIRNIILHARWATYETGKQTASEASNRPRLFVEGDLEKNRLKFEEMLTSTVETIAKGRNVTIIGPVPEVGYNLPAEMIKALMLGKNADMHLSRKAFDERQKDLLALLARLDQIEGVEVVYPHEILCDAEICKTSIDGMALYVDDDHLSPTGAALLKPLIMHALEK